MPGYSMTNANRGDAPMKGIIVDSPWIDELLAGRKTWELRGKTWKHRGEVALIRKGSGQVEGIANLVDCLPPLDAAAMRQTTRFHRVPDNMIDEVMANGWRIPWLLTDIRRLGTPVRYVHKSGAQTPVNLDAKAEREIRQQMEVSKLVLHRSHGPFPVPTPLALATQTGAEQANRLAKRPHLRGASQRSITDADVPRRQNSKGHGASEAGPTPALVEPIRSKRSRWRRWCGLVQVVAALVLGLSFLGWLGQLFLSGPIATLFSWAGWGWALVSIVSAVVMGCASGLTPSSRPAGRGSVLDG